ncbi:Hypothetical protein D9617_8g051850 [Elsinoe fawcettii]|nr:Hypothetical protein D9617_8g051850 [Elsinoe fawcettii]
MAGAVAALRGKSPNLGRQTIARKRKDSPKDDSSPTNGHVKRIKLSVSNPSSPQALDVVEPKEPEDAAQVQKTASPESRPKRNASKPKRYAEDLESPLSEKPAPQPTPPSSGIKITLKQKLKPTTPTPVSDDEEDRPASYSADFLMNYIDDTPPATPTGDKKSEDPPPRRVSAPIPDNPYKTTTDAARRESAPAHVFKSSKPAIPSPLSNSFTNDPNTGAYYSQVVDRPPLQDDEATMIRKLDIAIHALSRLNLPTPVCAAFEQRPDQQAGNPIRPAPQRTETTGTLPTSRTGTPDTELRILIHNAINLLRASLVNKTHAMSSQMRAPNKHKRDPSLQHSIEADKFAMSAIETLMHSSALNINCVITSQRTSRLWTLYQSLLFLISPPPPQHMQSVPPTPSRASPQSPVLPPSSSGHSPTPNGTPQGSPGIAYGSGTIEGAVDNFKAHQNQGTTGPPPPHQFLLREQQQSTKSPTDNPRTNGSMAPPPIPAHRGPRSSAPTPSATVSAR